MKAALILAALALPAAAESYVPVVTTNGSTLPYRVDHGVKVFHLVAEQVKREIAPGMVINAWGYNGQTPGPTIEAVEGDRVRILVTNHLPEDTSVHWHGVLLPNGMDGVEGLNQPHIKPGETFAYEFTLRQSGTQMYHPHADETLEMALGMEGSSLSTRRRSANGSIGTSAASFNNGTVLLAVPPRNPRPFLTLTSSGST